MVFHRCPAKRDREPESESAEGGDNRAARKRQASMVYNIQLFWFRAMTGWAMEVYMHLRGVPLPTASPDTRVVWPTSPEDPHGAGFIQRYLDNCFGGAATHITFAPFSRVIG
jgi:hypothetical protein